MSENRKPEEFGLVGALSYLERLVRTLKDQAKDANGNESIAASLILDEHQQVHDVVKELKDDANAKAKGIFDDLAWFLRRQYNAVHGDDDDAAVPEEIFWETFRQKIKVLESDGVNLRFRKSVFQCKFGIAGNSLMHLACQLNPPVEVVRTLLKVIPDDEMKHLALNIDGEYPLHNLVAYGASSEVVKLLIDADESKQSLDNKRFSDSFSVHILIQNKENHQPGDFSQILRDLVIASGNKKTSPLLYERCQGEGGMQAPAALLWNKFMQGGMPCENALNDADFIFLVKASYSHHLLKKSIKLHDGEGAANENGPTINQIERTPFSHAFLICAPGLGGRKISAALTYLFSIDSAFLLGKDPSGKYPIHQILQNPSYLITDTLTSSSSRHGYTTEVIIRTMVNKILKLAPQCAQQVDENGRLPLHVATDTSTDNFFYMGKVHRFKMIKTIWMAYPTAAGIIDKVSGLPTFALSLRREAEDVETNEESDDDSEDDDLLNMWLDYTAYGLSSAFFLLRKQPDAILTQIKKCACEKETDGQPKKRQRRE